MHIIIEFYFVHSSHFYKILDLTSLSLAIILGKMSEKKELFEFKEKSFNNSRRKKIMYTISSEKYLSDIHDIAVKLREKKRAGKNCFKKESFNNSRRRERKIMYTISLGKISFRHP